MARGFIGAAYTVVLSGIRRERLNLEGLKAFEAGVKSRKGDVVRVGSFETFENCSSRTVELEVLEVLDDDDDPVVFVKLYYGESDTVVRYRESCAPIGGKKLIVPGESVLFVTLENNGQDHPFIEHVIECCSAKLDALPASEVICADAGLNNTGRAIHYFSRPVHCPALLAIVPHPRGAFAVTCGRNVVIYNPPTLAQHTSTLELIDRHARRGSKDVLHHQRNLNSKNNTGAQADFSFHQQAEMTNDKAVIFTCDLVRGTIQDEYGICSAGATVEGKGNVLPLTFMQKMKATLLSDPKNKEAIAYLKPRVGAVHVEKLQACGRELKKKENEILALEPAASGSSATKKRRRA